MGEKKSNKERDSKKNQVLRIKTKKAARRSGKITKTEGKVEESESKGPTRISQKRMATIKKSRY